MIRFIVLTMLSVFEPPYAPEPPPAPPIPLAIKGASPLPRVEKKVTTRLVEVKIKLPPGGHWHQCSNPKCKEFFWHASPNNLSHACPKCGNDSRGNRYHVPAPIRWESVPVRILPPATSPAPAPMRVVPQKLPSRSSFLDTSTSSDCTT